MRTSYLNLTVEQINPAILFAERFICGNYDTSDDDENDNDENCDDYDPDEDLHMMFDDEDYNEQYES